ncbi:MAG: DUF2752 domain-containing protein [Phycisphaeraceae bacterium]|nr:DUF2752 domain-containing protein [Phycisphaeraceae bacterium]
MSGSGASAKTSRLSLSGSQRFAAALGCIFCASLLAVAAWLTPSVYGHGTHTQLGLPSCPWPQTVGGPCPTCGMTTAFALAADGRLVDSFLVQPFGCILAVLTACGFWASLHIAATGSVAGRIYGKLLLPRVVWTMAGLAVASWAYKWATWQS